MAMTQHYTLGIDMGASSVKVVALGTGAAAAEGVSVPCTANLPGGLAS